MSETAVVLTQSQAQRIGRMLAEWERTPRLFATLWPRTTPEPKVILVGVSDYDVDPGESGTVSVHKIADGDTDWSDSGDDVTAYDWLGSGFSAGAHVVLLRVSGRWVGIVSSMNAIEGACPLWTGATFHSAMDWVWTFDNVTTNEVVGIGAHWRASAEDESNNSYTLDMEIDGGTLRATLVLYSSAFADTQTLVYEGALADCVSSPYTLDLVSDTGLDLVSPDDPITVDAVV